MLLDIRGYISFVAIEVPPNFRRPNRHVATFPTQDKPILTFQLPFARIFCAQTLEWNQTCAQVSESVRHRAFVRTGLNGSVIGQTCALPSCMTKKTSRSDRISIEAVEGWLNSLCGMPPQRCPTCGSTMTDMSATFFLLDADKSWTALLPICSSCEPEVGRTLSVA
jgi:hypothetical protein